MEQNDGGIQDSINFSEYSGYWSYEGKTHEQILAEGGIGLSCTITGNNQFSGLLFSQQEITERLALIEDISGKIEQAELYFDYTDDGWGNSGTLHIQFLDDSIHVEVLDDKNADNDSDYLYSEKLILSCIPPSFCSILLFPQPVNKHMATILIIYILCFNIFNTPFNKGK